MVSSILALVLFVGFVLSPLFFVMAITVVDGLKRRQQAHAKVPAVDGRRRPASAASAAPITA